MYSIALLFICVCLWVFYLNTATFAHWKNRQIPFEKPVPLFGNLASFTFGFCSYYELFHEMYTHFKNSPVCGFFQMHEPALLIRDAELTHNILVGDFSNFYDRAFRFILQDKTLNPVSALIFMAKGNRWRTLRRKLNPIFALKKVRPIQDTVRTLLVHLDAFVAERMVDDEVDLDLIDPCKRFVMDILGRWTVGIDCKSLKGNDEFIHVAEEICRMSLVKSLTLVLPAAVRRQFKLPDFPVSVTDFYRKVILGTAAYRRENGLKKNDVLQQLMELQNSCHDPQYLVPGMEKYEKDDDELFDEVDILSNAGIILFGGEETVTTMSICLYELAIHQDMQNELRKEVVAAYEANNRTLNYDWLENLKYLDAVISETLRKYPPTPWLVRTNVQDYRIPNTDWEIEKGTAVVIPVWSIHHDERYYPNPEQFDPTRFYGENKKKIRRGTYWPFGGGPRMCIGYQVALVILRMALANAVLRYEFSCCPKTEIPLVLKTRTVILAPNAGVWVRMRKREI